MGLTLVIVYILHFYFTLQHIVPLCQSVKACIMSADYHYLLWQELNKNFGDGVNTMFVMRPGQQLLYSDYDVSCDVDIAAYNTFQLVNETLACSLIYTPNGSNISTMWEHIFHGKGPSPGPEHKEAFEKARKHLFKKYPDEKSKFYIEYDTKQQELIETRKKLKDTMKQDHGDDWEVSFDEELKETMEYIQFKAIEDRIAPHLQAIREWEKGPLDATIAHLEEGM